MRFIPAIIAFLEYDPRPEPRTFGERIRMTREGQGLTQRELARRLGVDPSTVWIWETEQVRHRWPRLVRLFEEYVREGTSVSGSS